MGEGRDNTSAHLHTPAGTGEADKLFLLAARLLARQIREQRSENGGWRVLRTERPDRAPQEVAAGLHLYHGTAGIAVFLAALHAHCGDEEDRELALEAIAPVRRWMLSALERGAPVSTGAAGTEIGGLIGVGGVIYALVVVGTALAEQAMLDEAHAASTLLTPQAIARDDHLDVVYGAAGALLAMLALERFRPGPNPAGHTPHDLAVACARHLASRRSSYDGLPPAWASLPGLPPPTGFAHGASGICFALAALGSAHEPEVERAIVDGLAYERALFSPQAGGWPDRPHGYVLRRWCYGAPGIALARLGVLARFELADARRDLELALEAMLVRPQGPDDGLCCGNMGVVDLLSLAHRELGDGYLREAARALAIRVLRAAKARGFGWYPAGESHPVSFEPGLFKGAAGAGYALLRLTAPGLPSVLALEPPT